MSDRYYRQIRQPQIALFIGGWLLLLILGGIWAAPLSVSSLELLAALALFLAIAESVQTRLSSSAGTYISGAEIALPVLAAIASPTEAMLITALVSGGSSILSCLRNEYPCHWYGVTTSVLNFVTVSFLTSLALVWAGDQSLLVFWIALGFLVPISLLVNALLIGLADNLSGIHIFRATFVSEDIPLLIVQCVAIPFVLFFVASYQQLGISALLFWALAIAIFSFFSQRSLNVAMHASVERDRAQSTIDLVPVIILRLNSELEAQVVNARGLQLSGRSVEELRKQSWADLLDEPHDEAFRQAAASVLADGEETSLETPLVSGEQTHIIAWRLARGRAHVILVSGEDITERRRAERRAEHLAYHDELTGLANRAQFTKALESILEKSSAPLALLFLDLDGFKRINDNYGHEAGDEALEMVARALERGLRSDDLVARYGGDEFLVLLRGLDPDRTREEAQLTAQRLIAQIEALDSLEALSASVGITIYPQDSSEAGELVRLADRRMYDDKRARRERGST